MSNQAIPTSTSVVESAVIRAQLAHVWYVLNYKYRTSQYINHGLGTSSSSKTSPNCELSIFIPAKLILTCCNSWSAVTKSEFVKGASEETDIVKWSFKDGTELEVKQEEHSVSLPLG